MNIMGADMGAMARNFLKAADTSYEELKVEINNIIKDIKISMFLTGAANISDLKNTKYIVFDPLYSWLDQGD